MVTVEKAADVIPKVSGVVAKNENGGVDELISQALGNGLDVPEGSLASLNEK